MEKALGVERNHVGFPSERQRSKPYTPQVYAIYGLAWLNTLSQIRDETDFTSAFSRPIIFELL